MSGFARLFADELAFLREVGRDFATANPTLAPLLAEEGGDPDVQRLLEGFAFLTARLRQRMQEDMPELMQDMLSVLAPQLGLAVPSLTTVEWAPTPRALSRPAPIPRGTKLRSRPVAGTACRFETCYDVTLAPLRLAALALDEGPRSATLKLRFETTEPLPVGRLGLERVRLHLWSGARPGLGAELLRRLLADGAEIRLTAGEVRAVLPPTALRPVGFAPEEAVLPATIAGDPGLRLVQEYLIFPQKFLYLDLTGLDRLAGAEATGFEAAIRLDHPADTLPRLEAGNVRLHCTPAVNRFVTESDPVTVDGSRTEYRLRAQGLAPDHATIVAAEAAWAWLPGDARRIDFRPFTAFDQLTAAAGERPPFFRTRQTPAPVGGGTETTIAFGFPGAADALRGAVATARLVCTNAELPTVLPPGGLDQADAASPGFATFRNIDPVTRQIDPPLGGEVLGPMIAVLAGGAAPITDLETLRRTIAALEFRVGTDGAAERALRLRLDALRGVEAGPLAWFVEGRPVRGQRIAFDIAEEQIGGQGEAWLLGAVLDGLLAERAPLNTCFQTVVRCQASGRSFAWPVHLGRRQAL